METFSRPLELGREATRRSRILFLAEGKERVIQHMMMTTFFYPDGSLMSAQQFMELLFGKLPDFFQSEAELRQLWSVPGLGRSCWRRWQTRISDTHHWWKCKRSLARKTAIFSMCSRMWPITSRLCPVKCVLSTRGAASTAPSMRSSEFFMDFVLAHDISVGVEELDQQKLATLLRLKYGAIQDAIAHFGQPGEIGKAFAGFQKYLYADQVA